MHELTHGQFSKMTMGEKVGTGVVGLVGGLAGGAIIYEVRTSLTPPPPPPCPSLHTHLATALS